MKSARVNHHWNLSLRRAAALQAELASRVDLKPLAGMPNTVAGIDTAEWNDYVFVAIVVMNASKGKVIEITRAHAPTHFQYVPGYRAFREGPIVLKAIRRLRFDPELFFLSGQGVCHPRFLGAASHLGLWLERPTIGCSNLRMVGHYEPPGEAKGKYSVIRYSPQAPGIVLRTREQKKPLFVSPGHQIDLLGAIDQTLRFCTKFRLPEPLRRARIEAGHDMRRFRDQHPELIAPPIPGWKPTHHRP